ncbi:hypothetical protein VULLAG_LOCUS10948 [Vulpes lagopus]
MWHPVALAGWPPPADPAKGMRDLPRHRGTSPPGSGVWGNVLSGNILKPLGVCGGARPPRSTSNRESWSQLVPVDGQRGALRHLAPHGLAGHSSLCLNPRLMKMHLVPRERGEHGLPPSGRRQGVGSRVPGVESPAQQQASELDTGPTVSPKDLGGGPGSSEALALLMPSPSTQGSSPGTHTNLF